MQQGLVSADEIDYICSFYVSCIRYCYIVKVQIDSFFNSPTIPLASHVTGV